MQLPNRMRHITRRERRKLVGLMRAVAHADTGAGGIERHLQVVRGVAHHQDPCGGNVEFVHELVQHARVGLAGRLVGGTGAVKHALECNIVQHFIQPAPRFARGDRQQVAARLERSQQRQHPLKQA